MRIIRRFCCAILLFPFASGAVSEISKTGPLRELHLATPERPREAFQEGRYEHLRVLVVSADPLALPGFLDAFKSLNVPQVFFAERGEGAFQLLETQSFDLIIVDQSLELGLTGVEWAKKFRLLGGRSQVVLLTHHPLHHLFQSEIVKHHLATGGTRQRAFKSHLENPSVCQEMLSISGIQRHWGKRMMWPAMKLKEALDDLFRSAKEGA